MIEKFLLGLDIFLVIWLVALMISFFRDYKRNTKPSSKRSKYKQSVEYDKYRWENHEQMRRSMKQKEQKGEAKEWKL